MHTARAGGDESANKSSRPAAPGKSDGRSSSRLSRLRSTVLSASLILLLGTTTPGCPLLTLVFGIWMGGPYAEFAVTCPYASLEELADLAVSCGDVGGLACIAKCPGFFGSTSAQKANQAGEEIFFAENSYRVAHRLPGAPADAEIIDYGRVPAGIALDLAGGFVYWADFRGNVISRATLDGSTVEPLPLAGYGAVSVAWRSATGTLIWTTGLAGKIQTGSPDGSGISDIITGLTGPGDIAIDEAGGKMYWANFTGTGTEIMRANLDGSSQETIHTSAGAIMNLTLELAGAKIYWSDATANEIRRANLDGSSVEAVITATTSPTALAVDASGGKIYWYDADVLNIRRANLDGSVAETIRGFSPTADMALDIANGHVFHSGLVDGQMKRMDLDGTNAVTLAFANRMSGEVVLDESRSMIYWLMQTGHLIRANYDGSMIDTIATGVSASSFAFDQATDKLYWSSGSNIMRSDPDGTNVENPLSGITFLSEVAVDGAAGYIYWIEQQTIGRANLDGTGPGTIFTDTNYPRDLAARNGLLYWTAGDKVRRIPGAGPFNATDLITGLASPFFIDVTDSYIYWHLVFTDGMQRAALDGTGVEDVGVGYKISGFDVAASGILPVELATFRGTPGDRSAALYWETASERNLAGFEIEQRAEGAPDWTRVGFEPAATGAASSAGESVGATYRYTVADLEPANYRFRLRIVDRDGSHEYSPTIEVFLPTMAPITLSNARPNPFSNQTTFTVTTAIEGSASVELYDVLGRRVRMLFDGRLKPDHSRAFALGADGLSPGTYFIKVTDNRGAAEVTKVVYVR